MKFARTNVQSPVAFILSVICIVFYEGGNVASSKNRNFLLKIRLRIKYSFNLTFTIV